MSEPVFETFALPLDAFIAEKSGIPPALIGSTDDLLLPAHGLLILGGRGGKGKTTLSVDGAFHLASGIEWLGLPVPRPLRVRVLALVRLVGRPGQRRLPDARPDRPRRRSRFQRDDELVCCNPNRGTVYMYETYRAALSEALCVSGVEEVSDERPTGRIRPFHDLRHTAITNDAASGSSALAVMTKAGHASMSTTQRYLHLAGVVFRTEAEALDRRLLGPQVLPEPSTDMQPPEAVSDALGTRNGAGYDPAA